MVSEPRSDSHRVLHRQGNKLIVWTIYDIGRVKFELAGETFRRSEPFLCDSMAYIARDTVARQRSVFAVGFVWQRENHAVFERLVLIQLQLSLAHHTVAPVTSVVEEFRA